MGVFKKGKNGILTTTSREEGKGKRSAPAKPRPG